MCVKEYLKQVHEFCEQPKDQFALTRKNTTGKIKKLLNETRIKSHVAHLDSMTAIEDYERKFTRSKNIKDVDDATRAQILQVSNGKQRRSIAHFSSLQAFNQVSGIDSSDEKGD